MTDLDRVARRINFSLLKRYNEHDLLRHGHSWVLTDEENAWRAVSEAQRDSARLCAAAAIGRIWELRQ